jgi:uncharacterized membrane protein
MATETKDSGPVARLKNEANGLVDALGDRATSALRNKVEGTVTRLTDYVAGNGGPSLMAAVTGAKSTAEGKGPVRSMMKAGFAGAKEKVAGAFGGRGKTGGKQKLKVTTIIESIDVGVPLRIAYDQWTQFRDFPTFMKKVENVDQAEDEKLHWKAQVFWSHREWEADILEQHPDDRIIWRSKGQKGHVDGAVTFHELAPNLTRIVVVMEYHPQGMFEHTANLWRAQGRRARLELKHFQRHVMAHAMLNPDEIEGWRGVIEEGEVVKDHETAMQEEDSERGEGPQDYESDEEPQDVENEELAEETGEGSPADEAGEGSGDRERPPARRRAGSGARQASRGSDRPERPKRAPSRQGAGEGGRPSRARGRAGDSAGRASGQSNGRRRGAA